MYYPVRMLRPPINLAPLPVIFPLLASALVETYTYPEVVVTEIPTLDHRDERLMAFNRRSGKYAVEVRQDGQAQACYVMHSGNPFEQGNLASSPDTHWTNFSMDGKAEVVVTLLDEPIQSIDLLPSRKGYTAKVEGNRAVFTIEEKDLPLQLYARINRDNGHALLIFADPPERNAPDPADTGQVELILASDDIDTVRRKLASDKPHAVFEKGVHQWGSEQGTGYAGYKLPYVSNKSIHIPGGAYVIGTFSGQNVHSARIHGRGVLSACGKDRIPGVPGIPYSMVTQTGPGSDQLVEGIISTDSPHFHLTYRGSVIIDNVKMLGWWHQTDGIVTGDDSIVRNTFIKSNDDYIKVYSQNCYYENNTLFHQVNGAPFQFCWSTQNGDNNLIKDTYIVYSVYSPGENRKWNTAVINARSAPGQVTENNVWDGIYIDNGCHRLIGIDAENEEESIFRNFLIRNVYLNSGDNGKPQDGGSYLMGGTVANFVNFRIENLVVDGKPVRETTEDPECDGNGRLWFKEGGGFLAIGD